MSFTDKARNKADEMAGATKEKLGDATNNERMQAEGATQRIEAKAKQAGAHVEEEAGRNPRDAFTQQ